MSDPEDGADFCVRCGTPLRAYRCKVRCLNCGYQEDCADAGLIDHDKTERGEERRRAREQQLREPIQSEQGDS
ncbi:MAG: hypothetical protein IT322_17040 [Anaerolineae bacterium]|nr:hypothetical protein [Anaerolineae bacterium]